MSLLYFILSSEAVAYFTVILVGCGVFIILEKLSKNAPAVLIALSQAYLKDVIRHEKESFLELERKYLEKLLAERGTTAKKLAKINKLIDDFRIVDAEEPVSAKKTCLAESPPRHVNEMGPHQVVYQSAQNANEYELRQTKSSEK